MSLRQAVNLANAAIAVFEIRHFITPVLDDGQLACNSSCFSSNCRKPSNNSTSKSRRNVEASTRTLNSTSDQKNFDTWYSLLQNSSAWDQNMDTILGLFAKQDIRATNWSRSTSSAYRATDNSIDGELVDDLGVKLGLPTHFDWKEDFAQWCKTQQSNQSFPLSSDYIKAVSVLRVLAYYHTVLRKPPVELSSTLYENAKNKLKLEYLTAMDTLRKQVDKSCSLDNYLELYTLHDCNSAARTAAIIVNLLPKNSFRSCRYVLHLDCYIKEEPCPNPAAFKVMRAIEKYKTEKLEAIFDAAYNVCMSKDSERREWSDKLNDLIKEIAPNANRHFNDAE